MWYKISIGQKFAPAFGKRTGCSKSNPGMVDNEASKRQI